MKLISKFINKQDCKILIVTDMHLKSHNPTNRKNYIKEGLSYLDQLIILAQEYQIDVIIFLGDIYDREFVGKNSDYIHQQILTRINKLKQLGIRVFTLMGNHEKHSFNRGCTFFLNIDWESNRLIEEFKLSNYLRDDYFIPTYEVCDQLIINNSICFHMHHFSDFDKNYLTAPNDFKCNIGLFHDAILPTKARQKILTLSETDPAKYSKVMYNDKMFNNLDYAVLGDIHARIGEMLIQTETGECLADTPGSVGRNSSSITESHEWIKLPLFVIQNNNVEKQHIQFKLWNYRDSFKEDLIANQRENHVDMKELANVLEQVNVKRDFVSDLDTFPEFARAIIREILSTGRYTSKTKQDTMSLLAEYNSL